jgi:hypothetical protein
LDLLQKRWPRADLCCVTYCLALVRLVVGILQNPLLQLLVLVEDVSCLLLFEQLLELRAQFIRLGYLFVCCTKPVTFLLVPDILLLALLFAEGISRVHQPPPLSFHHPAWSTAVFTAMLSTPRL